ncbi:MAG TPA: aminoacyl-tRNA hydrolase [Actinomycetota bacterium]|nr:aminoacyl-tRNA hydrolase [Actinomycetota bacterium]
MAWLVVGLGNPGDRYASTRHNIGWWTLEDLAERLGARLRKVRFHPLEVGETKSHGESVLLVRALTFMNEVGPPIASFARRRKVADDRIVVVHDDIDLGFGALRVKRGGSTAGHRGLNSLAGALRSPDFYRVRLGIGRPPGRKDPADYVLERFAKRERGDAEALAEEGAEAVLTLVAEGLERAQDRHNRSGPP